MKNRQFTSSDKENYNRDGYVSDTARWSIISAYNLASNKPYLDEPASSYTAVSKLPDKMIKDFATRKISADAGFLDPVNDKSLQ